MANNDDEPRGRANLPVPVPSSLPVPREHPEHPLGTMTAWQKKRELARQSSVDLERAKRYDAYRTAQAAMTEAARSHVALQRVLGEVEDLPLTLEDDRAERDCDRAVGAQRRRAKLAAAQREALEAEGARDVAEERCDSGHDLWRKRQEADMLDARLDIAARKEALREMAQPRAKPRQHQETAQTVPPASAAATAEYLKELIGEKAAKGEDTTEEAGALAYFLEMAEREKRAG